MFLVWFGYLCMAVDIYNDSHAALYFLYNKMPPMIRKGADLLRHGLHSWLFALMIKYGYQITMLNIGKPQPATRFSQGWLFAPLGGWRYPDGCLFGIQFHSGAGRTAQ